jgi:hypothetical protein
METIFIPGHSIRLHPGKLPRIFLADYKIAFEKGKPSTNIAKTI